MATPMFGRGNQEQIFRKAGFGMPVKACRQTCIQKEGEQLVYPTLRARITEVEFGVSEWIPPFCD
jgi:hypothetical protein